MILMELTPIKQVKFKSRVLQVRHTKRGRIVINLEWTTCRHTHKIFTIFSCSVYILDNKTSRNKSSFLQYLPLFWPVRQSGAAVTLGLLSRQHAVHTPIRHISLPLDLGVR